MSSLRPHVQSNSLSTEGSWCHSPLYNVISQRGWTKYPNCSQHFNTINARYCVSTLLVILPSVVKGARLVAKFAINYRLPQCMILPGKSAEPLHQQAIVLHLQIPDTKTTKMPTQLSSRPVSQMYSFPFLFPIQKKKFSSTYPTSSAPWREWGIMTLHKLVVDPTLNLSK